MVSIDSSVLESLRAARVELAHASGGDTVSLARPRARLTWIASIIPAECAEQRRLLEMAAQIASEVGLAQSPTRDGARLQSAVDAVTAVLNFFANPGASQTTRIDGAGHASADRGAKQ
jgi:hypothetical protein